MNTIWVVLPAYNEAKNLPRLLEEFRDTFAEHADLEGAIILIDDGSTDETYEIARNPPPGLVTHVLQNPENMGLGETFKRGMLEAAKRAGSRDIIVAMDADGSHLPGLVLNMVRRIREGRDVVIASRYQPGAVVRGVPMSRQLMSKGMSVLFRTLLPVPGVHDYSCGFRAYRASFIQEAVQRYGDALFQQAGFACMVDLLVKLDDMGAIFGEVPLVLRYDWKEGPSKLPVVKTVKMTLGVLGRERVRRTKGHVLGTQ